MLVTVGKIGRAHGLRGAVNIEVRTDQPQVRFAVGAQVTTDQGLTLTVAQSNSHSGKLLVQFAEITDRTAAEALNGTRLEAPATEARPDDEEWYEYELKGLRVETLDGQEVGTVIGLEIYPAQDLLVFKETNGTTTRIPLVTQLVPQVDLAGGVVRIDPPGGLLSTDSANLVVSEETTGEQTP